MNKTTQTPLTLAFAKAVTFGLNFTKAMTTKKVNSGSYVVFYDGIECGIFNGPTASHAKAAYVLVFVNAELKIDSATVAKALAVHAKQNFEVEAAQIKAIKRANEISIILKRNASNCKCRRISMW